MNFGNLSGAYPESYHPKVAGTGNRTIPGFSLCGKYKLTNDIDKKPITNNVESLMQSRDSRPPTTKIFEYVNCFQSNFNV